MRGFSLLEILVVVGLLALIATIVLVTIGSARKSSRDTKRQSDLKEIRSAIEFYISDARVAPDALADLEPAYIRVLPGDPVAGKSYGYVNLGGSSYALAAALENTGQGKPLDSDFDGAIPITIDGVAHDCSDAAGAEDESVYCLYSP